MEPRDIFLVFVEGKQGHHDAYARWFAGAHMADMARLPGVLSASAFRLEALDGQDVPARFCAIYETHDGAHLLQSIAAAKGTDALPVSDLQGAMTWRVLEGRRTCQSAAPRADVAELMCMFAPPWDAAAEDRAWDRLCDAPDGIARQRQTRLSPVQPARGSDFASVLFVTLDRPDDAAALAATAVAAHGASEVRLLLAVPLAG